MFNVKVDRCIALVYYTTIRKEIHKNNNILKLSHNLFFMRNQIVTTLYALHYHSDIYV